MDGHHAERERRWEEREESLVSSEERGMFEFHMTSHVFWDWWYHFYDGRSDWQSHAPPELLNDL